MRYNRYIWPHTSGAGNLLKHINPRTNCAKKFCTIQKISYHRIRWDPAGLPYLKCAKKILCFENTLQEDVRLLFTVTDKMCTKTSHHSLCMTTARIMTPIVSNDWYHHCSAVTWTVNWISSVLARCIGSCYSVLMVHKKMTQLSTSLSSPQLPPYKAVVELVMTN